MKYFDGIQASATAIMNTRARPAGWKDKNPKMHRTCYIIGCFVLSADRAFAHPGHGHPAGADGIEHYLFSPLHVGPIAATTVVLLVANYALRRVVMMHRRRSETLDA